MGTLWPAAKKQSTERTGLVHHYRGVDGRQAVVPDSHCRTRHGRLWFADPLVEFDIQGGATADSRVKVREVTDDPLMEMLEVSTHVLSHDVSIIRLIVQPNSLHAWVKQFMNPWSASSEWAVRSYNVNVCEEHLFYESLSHFKCDRKASQTSLQV